MDDDEELTHVEKFLLEKVKFGFQMHMSNVLINELRVRTEILDYMADKTVRVMVTGFLMGGTQRREVLTSETFPASWWEELKERRAPAWFLARYPVRMRTMEKTIIYQNICPHTNSVPERGVDPHLTFLSQPPRSTPPEPLAAAA